MPGKFAISVGVAQAGTKLAYLPGAILDAKKFAAWARGDGYRTTLITDEKREVRADRIGGAVRRALKAGPGRLLIYYSGHGTASQIGDLWLLSGIDEDSDEVINVNLSMINAKRQPIHQIAVFADACRSSVDDMATIGGRSIFPRTKQRTSQPDWEHFFATGSGSAAQEASGGDPALAYGIFSQCLFEALEGDAMGAVEQRGRSGLVVASAGMKRWLLEAVPRRSGAVGGAQVQFPDIQLAWEAPNDVYATLDPRKLPDLEKMHPEARKDFIPFDHGMDDGGIDDFVTGHAHRYPDGRGREIKRRRAERNRRDAAGRARVAEAEDAIAQATEQTRERLVVGAQVWGCGVSVFGAEVDRIAVRGSTLDVSERDGGVQIRAFTDKPRTIAIRLDGGNWFATVLLPDFVTLATVSDGAVIGLAHRKEYQSPDKAHEKLLRDWTILMGESAAPAEVFLDTAQRIRVGKHRNPSLGILAAYAYERAGDLRGIDSMIGYFAAEHQPIPYDLALLSTYALRRRRGQLRFVEPVRHHQGSLSDVTIAGSFPLMGRGWSMLDPANRSVHPALIGLRSGLLPSLGTMLNPAAGERLAGLIEGGEL